MLATATLPLSSTQSIRSLITTSIFPLSVKSGTSSYLFESWRASLNADRIDDPDFKVQFVNKKTGFGWSLACPASEARATNRVRANVLIAMSPSQPPSAGLMRDNHTRNTLE